MEFGVHHRWTDEQVFTEAGVKILMDKLAETHPGPALELRAAARLIFVDAVPEAEARNRELVAPLGRHRVEHNPLNGYVAEPDL